jgi:hypothetical protein
MSIVDFVCFGLRRFQVVNHDFGTDYFGSASWFIAGNIFGQWLQGVLNVHFWVGNEGAWALRERKKLNGEILPGGGKKVPGNRYFVIPGE